MSTKATEARVGPGQGNAHLHIGSAWNKKRPSQTEKSELWSNSANEAWVFIQSLQNC